MSDNRSAIAMAIAATLACAATAHAQDHLKCYKIKDPHSYKATVNLVSAQFGAENGCEVKVKGRYYCTPVTKQVVQTNAPVAAVTGDDLTDDRICYKMKCATSTITDQSVTDQFGTRTLSKFKPALVCTPAFTGTASTTTTTVPTATGPCCEATGSYCGGPVDPVDCTNLGLTPADQPTDVCNATTGVCGATAAPGPCCDTAVDCAAGPGVTSGSCSSIAGTFVASAVCNPMTGNCEP